MQPTQNSKLFLISFIMLFLEILLIRWISTEVRIFAYIGNLVLLACFLGIGVGCYFSRKKEQILITLGMLVLIVLAVRSEPFRHITDMLSAFPDAVIWYQIMEPFNLRLVLQGIGLTLFMFLMILTAFIPLGQILGKLLDEHPKTIEGYSVNIVASLIGIWAFNIFALYYTPPWLWFLFSLILLFFFRAPLQIQHVPVRPGRSFYSSIVKPIQSQHPDCLESLPEIGGPSQFHPGPSKRLCRQCQQRRLHDPP